MSSDHTPLIVNIFIFEEQFQTRKQTIIKNGKEEMRFITKIIKSVKRLNLDHIKSKEDLEQLVQEFMHNIDKIWLKHSKIVNITRHSKSWWSEECQRGLEKYRSSRFLEDWKNFKSVVKKIKWGILMLKSRKL